MPPRKTEGPEPGDAPFFVRSKGRGRTGSPGPSNRAPASPAPDRTAPWGTPRLTGRGGVLLIMLLSFVGILIAHFTGAPTVLGVAFTTGCLLTAALVRPSDLLSLAVSPPIAFFAAVLAAEGLLALGSDGFVRVLLLGLASRLADVAPWLFLGTALLLVIGVFRGLPRNIRKLGDELNGRT